MENDWTREIDRLRTENAALAAELAMAQERIRIMDAWMQTQVSKLRQRGGEHG
uniref:Uncharacterized protein n=1 Tax=viral metagenome TaxID=1070528 RepID=A0A6M3IY99_9ZZZZ